MIMNVLSRRVVMMVCTGVVVFSTGCSEKKLEEPVVSDVPAPAEDLPAAPAAPLAPEPEIAPEAPVAPEAIEEAKPKAKNPAKKKTKKPVKKKS